MNQERICQFVAGCPIFAYYERTLMRECLANYCLGNFEGCRRRILRLAGESVPPDLLPDGTLAAPGQLDAPPQSGRSDVRTVI